MAAEEPIHAEGRMAGRRVLIVGAGQQDYGIDDAPIGNGGRATAVQLARRGRLPSRSPTWTSRAPARTAELVAGRGRPRRCHGRRRRRRGRRGALLQRGLGGARRPRRARHERRHRRRLQACAARPVEEWDRVLAINLRSHFLGCRQALTSLRGPGGSIVLVGSLAARESIAAARVFPPRRRHSKRCVETPRSRGAPEIRVNTLVPGLIDHIARPGARTSLNPGRGKVHIPAGRQGSAWEVARCAAFLLSGEASYVTGQALVADGGLSVAMRT